MAIVWDNTSKIFTATADVGAGDSWANAFNEDDFFNVGGQAGVTKDVSMPALNIYKWVGRIEIADATYVLWKNTVHVIEVTFEMNNESFFTGLGPLSYLAWGEKINGNPQNGISISVDDTNYYIKYMVDMPIDSLSVTNLYSSSLKTVLRNTNKTTKAGLSLLNLEGEILDIKIEGFRYGYYISSSAVNNLIIDHVQVIDSGALAIGAFHLMAEMSTPVKKIFITNCRRGLQGHGAKTPNIDFWNVEGYNSSIESVGTKYNYEITVRVINSVIDWSKIFIYDYPMHAIEECYSLKIHSDANAKVYFKDASELNAHQGYSGSKLDGDIDNAQTLINVDSGTDFAVGGVIKINMEHMLVGSINANQLTVTRGYNATVAANHADNMWIWKVPDYVTLDGNGNLSVQQPEGVKDYLVFPKRRWDKIALDLTTFNNHKIKIEKAGIQTYEDTITEYPAEGIVLEIALQTRLYAATALKTTIPQQGLKTTVAGRALQYRMGT